jgi:GT2 family glycosyltransferase
MSLDPGRAAIDDGALVVDILLATHRRVDLLREMLSSLAVADDLEGVRQILLIENGIRGGSDDVAREFHGVIPIRYEFVEQANKSAALNHGLRMSDADLLIFFDDDVRVSPGTIPTYVEAAPRYGRGHFFGGRVTPRYEGEPPPPWLVSALPYTATGFDLGSRELPHHEFLGPNWAAFRQDLTEIGGFSTRLGPGSGLVGQETEAQSRLTARGSQGVFLPGAHVEHFVPAHHLTVGWVRRRRYRHMLGRALRARDSYEGPRIASVPRFLWRSYAEQLLRLARDRLLRPHTEERVQAELRLTKVRAQIACHRLRARGDTVAGGELPGGDDQPSD